LWRKTFFSAPERRTPSIIEAWFNSSDRIRQFGSSRPMVEIAASFDTKPEVKTSAGFLAVQVGELKLELDQRMVGAGNVARAAGARAHAAGGILHGAITSGCCPMPR
jgi:hypothetical protein